jgi:hypothetical protein
MSDENFDKTRITWKIKLLKTTNVKFCPSAEFEKSDANHRKKHASLDDANSRHTSHLDFRVTSVSEKKNANFQEI